MPLIDVPTVHAVTDDQTIGDSRFLARASAIIRALGPKVAIHLRARSVPAAALMRIAEALSPVARSSGSWLVINDRVDLAVATNAHGVQLGSRGLTVADARRMSGSLGVGVSVHSPGEARAAADESDRPDWLIAGNVFATESHPDRPPLGVELVRAAATTGLPIIAIGGVRPQDVAALRAAGARGVAAIRGIWNADDPADAASLYL